MFKMLVIFAIIGVLVTLLFLCKVIFLSVLAFKHRNDKEKYFAIQRTQEVSTNFEDSWFLVPTINIHKCNEYIEVAVKCLKWELYTSYKITNEF